MEDEPKQEVVGFSVPSTEGEMILHWFNTRIRTFKDPQFNHVEFRDDDDVLKGLRVTQAFMDILFEHEFPYQFDPVVDEPTKEWLISSEVKLLNQELDEM